MPTTKPSTIPVFASEATGVQIATPDSPHTLNGFMAEFVPKQWLNYLFKWLTAWIGWFITDGWNYDNIAILSGTFAPTPSTYIAYITLPEGFTRANTTVIGGRVSLDSGDSWLMLPWVNINGSDVRVINYETSCPSTEDQLIITSSGLSSPYDLNGASYQIFLKKEPYAT
jgi:hypothetical protein